MNKMPKQTRYVALGLMSGTSLDGIDAALVRTDGWSISAFGPSSTFPYPDTFREKIRGLFGRSDVDAKDIVAVERELTLLHLDAVKTLLDLAPMAWQKVDVIGFHGQTIHHAPLDGVTIQIGDGALLAETTGSLVVSDFRSADVAAGGEGAPLVPVFHQALVGALTERPLGDVAVLNLGGVGNVTVVTLDGDLLAFDTGPGNALLDDWVCQHTDQYCDMDGKISAQGCIDQEWLAAALKQPYFSARPPKSLDRNAFPMFEGASVSVEDGAATLAEFTVQTIAKAEALLPVTPRAWVVCGGGRHNPTIMAGLQRVLKGRVYQAEDMGWSGDSLEAQAFGYLAVRSMRGLPLTFPKTTGVAEPQTGGQIDRPL